MARKKRSTKSTARPSPPSTAAHIQWLDLLIPKDIQQLIKRYHQGTITQDEPVTGPEITDKLAPLLPFIESHGDFEVLGQLLKTHPDLLFHPIVLVLVQYLRGYATGPYVPHPAEQEEIDEALKQIAEGWVAGLFPGHEIQKIPKKGRPSQRDWIKDDEDKKVLKLYEEVLKVIKRYCLKQLPHEANDDDKDKWKRRLIQKTIPEICQKCGIQPGPKNTLQSWVPGFPEERVQEFTETIQKWAAELIQSDAPILRDALAYRMVGFVYHLSPNAVKNAISSIRPVKRKSKKTKPSP